MKTKPMAHQVEGLRRLAAAPDFYALGAEQGTGKTWMLLADAESQYQAKRIEAMLVVAPKGVHTNWVLREVPTHLEVPHAAAYYLSSANKAHSRTIEQVFEPDNDDKLRILAINIDALNTAKGYGLARRFLITFRTFLVVDESQRIKNPSAGRTQKLMTLGDYAISKRIASGTIIGNGPLDAFSQFQFLRSGLLGTTSYRAFVATYAELLPQSHELVQHAARNSRAGTPQIIKRTPDGQPMFKNLERLHQMMAPHMYRVLKRDCLDLPPKVYQNHYFELTPAQRRLYEKTKSEMMYLRDDGDIDMFTALTVITKLRQITSGFIMVDGVANTIQEDGPRLQALREIVEDIDGQFIIWAAYREEIARIAAELDVLGVVQYHGGISAKEREQAIDAFQSGDARVFIGHPQSGGTGLTLTAAQTAIYYSCDFSLEQRSQSEDRCHRIGTKGTVTYIDLVAVGTIDERIAAALQAKSGTAKLILGDTPFSPKQLDFGIK